VDDVNSVKPASTRRLVIVVLNFMAGPPLSIGQSADDRRSCTRNRAERKR